MRAVQIQNHTFDVQRAVEETSWLPRGDPVARVFRVLADVPADRVAAGIAFPGSFDNSGATRTDQIQFRVAEQRLEMSTPLLPRKIHLNIGHLERFHV